MAKQTNPSTQPPAIGRLLMSVTARLVSRFITPEGRVQLTFADGSGFDFANVQELRDTISQQVETMANAQLMCVAFALARSPDLSNVNSVLNKDFTLDLSAANPIKVQ
jgi:hypothetical protein